MPNRARCTASIAASDSAHLDMCCALPAEEVDQQLAWRPRDVGSRFPPPCPDGTSGPCPLKLKSCAVQPPSEEPAPRLTLPHRASSMAGSLVRGPRPLALRTSSWWTKNSLRLGSRRTHPMRKKPGGGPDRSVATSHVKSLSASALLRRSARRLHPPGRTSPGPARESRSRRIRCAARSRAVHGSRSVGAWGPRTSSRSLSCARSTASRNSAISPECSQAGGGFRGSLRTSYMASGGMARVRPRPR